MLKLSREETDDLLFRAMRAIFQFERQKIATFGLSFEAIYLLQFLRRRSPMRIGEIASEMMTPISTLSRTIGRLQKRELVERIQDPVDRRSMRVSLLPKGEKIVKAVEADSFGLIMKNLEMFTPEDIQAFIYTAASLETILRIEGSEK